MNDLLNGSICLDKIIKAAKEGNKAFTRGNDGKVYFAVTVWVNENANEHGQHGSIQLNLPKESNEKGEYIGNLKRFARRQPEALAPNDDLIASFDETKLPF